MLCLVALVMSYSLQPMDCSPPGSSVHGDSLGKNAGVGCHALLQGICPIQGLNPGFPHSRQIPHCLSHQEALYLTPLLHEDGREKGGSSDRFPLLGLENHCRWWLKPWNQQTFLGRKAMTNLDSVLKSRDITLLTKAHIVKALIFPVVMHGCERWTVKKAEH